MHGKSSTAPQISDKMQRTVSFIVILYKLETAGIRFNNEHISMSNRHFSEVLASFSEAVREQLLSGLRILEEVLAKRMTK